VKVDVVNEDPLEQGRRVVLNLGHTFAHGLEKASGYRIGHGDAVGVGLRAAARLGCALGLADAALEDTIVRALERWRLPIGFEGLSAADVRDAMDADKKRVGRKLRFVVPRRVGEVTIVEGPDERVVEETLRSVLA
jgi:3-dehydroquinate synthetase